MTVLERTLSQVAIITMGTSPKGDTYNQDGSGLPLLNGPTEFGPTYPNCTMFTTDSKRECRPGDLIFCVRGSTTGRMNWADRLYSLGRGVCSIRGKSKTDTQFIKYCLDWKLESLLKYAGGGTFPNLTQDTIRDFKIPFPEHRHKIASILSAYDDLIENNLRRIKLLESMAQNLYREWFVKFRFPGHEKVRFIDSPLGKIPEGWEVRKLGDIADISWGDTSTTKASYLETGFDAYSASGLDGKLDHYDFNKTGIVVSAIGAQCGKTWLARGKWSCIKNTIRFWSIDEYVSTEFLFVATEEKDFWPRRGSAQPFISQGDAEKKKLLIPNYVLMEFFSRFTVTTLEQIAMLQLKIKNLRRTRDLLLPKLISGEVDVSGLDIASPDKALA